MTEQVQDTSRAQGKRDLRQEITDRFVAALEQNQIPWERPWGNLEHGQPRNMATGNDYKGGNRLLLQLVQMDQGYADPRFGTIKQINDLGGRVNKGEKGHPIELWKNEPFWERADVTVLHGGRPVRVFDQRGTVVDIGNIGAKSPDILARTSDLTVMHKGERLDWSVAHAQLARVTVKTYVVFNAEQCKDLKLEPLQAVENRVPAIERGEQLMQAMSKDGVAFRPHAEAFYSPTKDEIYLPDRGAFRSQEGYYGTALHEIGHATGAAQRLNRDGITGGHRFHSDGYAKEELRAELFSTFMAAETGIPHDEEQHRAYVQFWAKVLKDDKNELFRAASEAGKAVDYVLGKEKELMLAPERSAEKAPVVQDAPEPSEPRIVTSVFVHKPSDAEHLVSGLARKAGVQIEPGKIIEVRELSPSGYDAFTKNMYAHNDWLKGKGGIETLDNGSRVRRVIEVTADQRQTLHVDPSGYDYARIVGVPEVDVARVVAAQSLVTGHTQPPLEKPLSWHDAMAGDGWTKESSSHYGKVFYLTIDASKGGEFSGGRSVIEKSLSVSSTDKGFAIAHGWNTHQVEGQNIDPVDATRLIDSEAKALLTKEYAHLGVTAVRGQNETIAERHNHVAAEPVDKEKGDGRGGADQLPARNRARKQDRGVSM